jgi:cytoskeletal protein CcmA (bactofilin family)
VNPYLAVAALVLTVSLMFMLPLIPALVELRRKSDALPLAVVQQNAGDVRHFANSFRSYTKGLEPIIQGCQAAGTSATGTLPDGQEYVVLGQVDEPLVLALQQRDATHPVVVAAAADLVVPPDSTFSKDIYVRGQFEGGANNNYRAILGEKDVRLGASSRVSRWVHAVGEFTADLGSELLGRISSDTSIRLHAGCSFVRLNAPRIQIGHGALPEDATTPDPSIPINPGLAMPQRLLHDGDFEIQASRVIRGNIVIRGNLLIRSGARVCGSVKCVKDMFLEEGVAVEGSLISAGKMRIGPRCTIHGPVVAERELAIESGTRCGSLEHPTTVSAPRIEVEENVMVFGTLWAREHGQAVPAS